MRTIGVVLIMHVSILSVASLYDTHESIFQIPLEHSVMSDQLSHYDISSNSKNVHRNHHKRQVTQRIVGNIPGSLFTYVGIVQFGTPSTQHRFLFDSGSSRTWIKSPSCNCGGSYASESSSTFSIIDNTLSNISYADGTNVSGSLVTDRVAINGLIANQFSFVLATYIDVTNSKFINQYDGITGFGFPSKTANSSLILQLIQASPSLAPVVSYYIDFSETHGGITIGGIDLGRFSGNLAVQEIVTPAPDTPETFSLKLDSIKVDQSTIDVSSIKSVLIDTGTSLTVLPSDVAMEIHRKLDFLPLGDDFPGLYGIFCPGSTVPNKLPAITMTLGKVKLRFTPDVYTFPISDGNNTYCVSGIQGSDLGLSIIGNVLLRRYYTVFDLYNKKIGFATCNRDMKINSSIILGDLSSTIKGIADPSSVFGETSSESFGHSLKIHAYLLAFLISIYM